MKIRAGRPGVTKAQPRRRHEVTPEQMLAVIEELASLDPRPPEVTEEELEAARRHYRRQIAEREQAQLGDHLYDL